MRKEIFYLFSSAYRLKYKQDNIDVVAAPVGYVIGFRYNKEKYVHKNVLSLEKNKIIGKKGLVIYVERDAEKGILNFHPLRMVRIKELNEIGNTYKVYLEMDKFCVTDDLEAFNQELKAEVPDLPYIEIEKGKFFTKAELVKNVREREFIDGFEHLAKELKYTIDYKDSIFYCVPEIELLAPKKSKELILTRYKDKIQNYLLLDSANSYQFTIYHHNPDLRGFRALRLILETDPNSIKMISEDYFEFTSAYDEEKFEIYTRRLHSNKFSHLVIKPNVEDVLMPKISIPIVVRYNWFYTFSSLSITGLGVFFAGLSSNIPNVGWRLISLLASAFVAGVGLFLRTRKD